MDNGFRQLGITKQFDDALAQMGVSTPTEIQEKAIAPARAGQDILGIAQTGSGKTLAYLLPLVGKIKFAKEQHPRALILAPSKELVIQIFNVLSALIANTDIRAICLYGGVGKKEQVGNILLGADILVSTPGRFLDLYSSGDIFPRQIQTLVLDEADRMMEMGFMPQLRNILEVIPVKRQNLLFSATFPERVERLAAEFLEFPTRIEAADIQKPVKEVTQRWYPVANFRTKLLLLMYFLEDTSWNRVMVFCRTKDAATRVFKYLERQLAHSIRVLHGNKSQNARINALDEFKSGLIRVLITTDVTSRGIDVDRVSHVVNFELPGNPEDYLHRIGRTARISREGVAISLVNPAEITFLRMIEKYLNEELAEAAFPESVKIAAYLPDEKQEIARAIDAQKKRSDPTFKGAFHEKQRKKLINPKKNRRS